MQFCIVCQNVLQKKKDLIGAKIPNQFFGLMQILKLDQSVICCFVLIKKIVKRGKKRFFQYYRQRIIM